MSNDVTFNLTDVVNDLGIEIANLKIHLVKEKRAKEAYIKRVEELEAEKSEWETRAVQAEHAINNTPVCTCE